VPAGLCVTGNDGVVEKLKATVCVTGKPGHVLMSEYLTVYVVAPVGFAVTTDPVVVVSPPEAGADHV